MDEYDVSETYTVELESAEGIRADRYIADHLGLFTRSQIKSRNVIIGFKGKNIRLSKILHNGDTIRISYNEQEPHNLIPENIKLDIIYENRNLIVINKAQGMVVHPGAGNFSGTLVHGLLYHCLEIKKRFPEDDPRPGVVHRLDKDTSGVIITAKDPDFLEYLSSQFREKRAKKSYLAVVKGVPKKKEGILDTYIARDLNDRKKFTVTEARGKRAVTQYRVMESWNNFSLIHLKPETGRTHQLRVHMLFMGNPILGDPVYGRKSDYIPDPGLMLHAYRLSIAIDPGSGTVRTFSAGIPERFTELIKRLSRDPENIISAIKKIQD